MYLETSERACAGSSRRHKLMRKAVTSAGQVHFYDQNLWRPTPGGMSSYDHACRCAVTWPERWRRLDVLFLARPAHSAVLLEP